MSIWGIGVTLGRSWGPRSAVGSRELQLALGVLHQPPGRRARLFRLLATLPESRNAKSSSFDFFGFTTLSIAIAGLQTLLDRGQTLDWFSSPEIMARRSSAASRSTCSCAHVQQQPAVPEPALFRTATSSPRMSSFS